MKAIALLEVQAMVAAITGLDAMVKAANVKLIHVEKRLGGRLVTVVVEGEVSAVTAALEAGAAAAAEVGIIPLMDVSGGAGGRVRLLGILGLVTTAGGHGAQTDHQSHHNGQHTCHFLHVTFPPWNSFSLRSAWSYSNTSTKALC